MLKILELLTYDQLPHDKNDKHKREFEIASRFVASQKSIYGREFLLNAEYQEQRKEDQPPDCKASEGNINWHIELTEVVYQEHAGKNAKQNEYAQSIQRILKSKFKDLEGIAIYVDDNYQEPPFPDLNKPKGQIIVDKIIAKTEDNLDKIRKLKYSESHIINRTKEDKDIEKIRLFVYKSPNLKNSIEVRFPNHFPLLVKVLRNLLKTTIQKKEITRPDKSVKNMLLVWDVRTMALPRDLPGNQPPDGLGFDEQIKMANDVLKKYGATFDEVWYFLPFKEYDKGHMVRIFPKESIK